MPPALMRLSDTATIMSAVARLIATGTARTKPELASATGLARSTLASAVRRLQNMGLIREAGLGTPTGRGRPPEILELSPDAGVVLIADLTPHHIRGAVVRLTREVLAWRRIEYALSEGPEPTLATTVDLLHELLGEIEQDAGPVRAVVASLPGPVDIRRGMPVRPPIMPGWDGFPVTDHLSAQFNCPCLADNDVNLMALGEARALPPDQCPMLFVKVGTGIGGGLISEGGVLHRGADGAACDIGHLRVAGVDDVICSCGNVGCVEAIASAEAITEKLRVAQQNSRLTRADLDSLVRSGDALAIRLIRDAAAVLGETVAALVHVWNPARIVLGGPLSVVSDDLLAGVRSVVYQRALPLATRNLTLAHSVLGDEAGLMGAAVQGIEHVLSPTALAHPAEMRR
jgi:predicted NBD/HSP70 family sugar kinase